MFELAVLENGKERVMLSGRNHRHNCSPENCVCYYDVYMFDKERDRESASASLHVCVFICKIGVYVSGVCGCVGDSLMYTRVCHVHGCMVVSIYPCLFYL